MKRFLAAALAVLMLCGCTLQGKPNEYSDTRFLMDTVCTIRAGGGEAQAAVTAAFERIEEIAAAVDYYSDTSEVSAINRAKAGEAVSIGRDVEEILAAALDISEKSNGAFDITVAPLKDLWRFSDGSHEPPEQENLDAALAHVGYKKISLADGTVTKSDSEIKIDLGGAAKGYAADCAAEVLRRAGVPYALIDRGGNIYALGKNPSRSDGGWLIGLQKPFGQTGEYFKTVTISEGAVVTSGTYQRFFEWNGALYHHILDPKNGCPANSGISSASIISDSALLADCLSTACMVLGRERGESLAAEYGAELICAEN